MKALAILPVMLVLAASPAALHAADPPALGVQAAVAFPVGDLPDVAKPGILLGGHGRWDFGGGHGLMARADLGLYASKDGASTNSFGAAADYTYHVDHNRRGLYLLAGVSFMNYSISRGSSASRSGFGPDLGIGYDLTRNLGIQARYTTHSLDGATMASLNLGATWTF